jgi:hypothetical protein
VNAAVERPGLVTLLVFFVIPVAVLALVVWAYTRSAARRREAAHVAARGLPATPPAGVAPGWYPQPDGTRHYWDGSAWTERPDV